MERGTFAPRLWPTTTPTRRGCHRTDFGTRPTTPETTRRFSREGAALAVAHADHVAVVGVPDSGDRDQDTVLGDTGQEFFAQCGVITDVVEHLYTILRRRETVFAQIAISRTRSRHTIRNVGWSRPSHGVNDDGRRFLQELPTQRRKDYARVSTSITYREDPWRDRRLVRRVA